MAWFRRKRDEEPADEAPVEAPSAASGDEVVRAERSHVGDWMAVPPLATTVGPPPTTFRVQRVSEIMTTRRPMAFYGQLGHQVSSSAPSGHVDGLTTTVAPPTAAPHPIDLPLHARSHEDHDAHAGDEAHGAHDPVPVPAEPPVQRSVRDLAPDEPVTAQTLGVSRQAIPVVQRAVAAAAAPAPVATRSLPEPSPTRVLREPTRAPSPLETRVPSIPVVGAPAAAPVASSPGTDVSASTEAGTSSTGDFYEPAAPVEFVVRSGEPAAAPLAGDVPLQRAADVASAPSSAVSAPRSVDLPLAAPPTADASRPPASPSDEAAPVNKDLMPPIQPRAVQRRAAEAAAAVAPTAGVDENGLPPLPSWAIAASGPGASSAAAEATASGETMPLHTTPAASTAAPAAPTVSPSSLSMQRETDADADEHFEGDGHDHGDGGDGGASAVQREADTSASVASASSDGGDAEAPGSTAPLIGERPLVDLSPDPTAEPGADSTAALDLPLQVSPAASPAAASTGGADSAGAAEAAATPAVAVGTSVQREAAGEQVDSSDGDEPARVAPLLGDRPLQLQRAADAAPAAPVAPGPTNPLSLPLVADVAAGPALASAPTAAPASTAGAASELATSATVQRSAATLAAPSAPSHTGATGATASNVAAASALPLRTLPASTGASLAAATATAAAPEPSGAGASAAPALASPFVTPAQRSALTTVAPVAVQTSRETASAPAMPLQEPSSRSASDDGPMLLGDAAVAAGLAQRDVDGSVVFNGAGAANGGATSLPIQREVAGGFSTVDPTGGPSSFVVQRAETDAATTTASVAPSADAGDDDKSTDELAAKVYERIRWKLASDLRADQRRLGASQWKGR